ncbi:hypothetical protein DNTS_026064 [Danionella cerebrum]|uniref:Leucine-rich repeat-containing protein 42 n=1 Tax=Danionella cerebrum TaxID=2873325 RepID=A0A553Q2L6_9TELE|nr:hypothetical protein DNTS_026064 [Danionella translucida]
MFLSDEYGAVFVRENGVLRCATEGRKEPKEAPRRRLFSRNFSLQLCSVEALTFPSATSQSSRTHFKFTYNKEGSLRYSVKSLFDISLQFIADHIEHVDSLVGFPEQMAEKLFSASEERHKFTDTCTGASALQLFCDAYGDLVLKSLCLRNSFHLVSERLEEIRQFQSLECLDLYGCRLGDEHGVFQHITSEALTRLAETDRPHKDNSITEKGLGYLTCFKTLQKLDISGTNVTVNMSLKRFFRTKMEMILSETPLSEFGHSNCKTDGWAEQVIRQWEITAAKVSKKERKPRTNAASFYGREKFIREALNSWSGTNETTNEIEQIHFHKVKPCDSRSVSEHSTHLSPQRVRKRRPSVEEEQSFAPLAKRQSLSAEDIELLNSY